LPFVYGGILHVGLQKTERECPVIDPGDEAPFLVWEVMGELNARAHSPA